MGLFTGSAFPQFINGKANVLGSIYTRAYNDLIREMKDFSNTTFARDRATAMLARVDERVALLDAETKTFVHREVPAVYFATANDIKKDIRKLNFKVPTEFSTIHYQATEAMAKDAMLKFGHTMTGIKRSAEDIVKFASQKATREIIAAGQLQGRAALDIAKEVQAKIADDGITALVDKGGKQWQLDTYANMLTRQMLSNSGREGVMNTAQEFGFDLAIITTHGSDHPECAAWEGKTISLSGKTEGYPSLDDATEGGLFHVGCRHGYTITTESGKPKPFTPQNKYDDVRVGDEILSVKDGHFYRTMDAKEYAYMLNTGELAPTPKGLFGQGKTDNKKYFGSDPKLGAIVANTYAKTDQQFTIAVPIDAMPKLNNDPSMKGQAVYVTEPIPISVIKLVK